MIARALHLLLAVGGLEVALARLVREVEQRNQRPTDARRRRASSIARAGRAGSCAESSCPSG
jgi:hypothetical protein